MSQSSPSTTPSSAPGYARGMRDHGPDQMRAFRRAEDAFRAAAGRWGYEEVRTPAVEPFSLYTAARSLTPQMLSRVYSFLDWDGWSGERVVLRPDSTIPVVRAAATEGPVASARLSYVQSVFRFGEEGDDAEDWQFGLEYLGAPAIIGDLEVAAVACETLETVGIPPEVGLSHVGLTHAAVDEAAHGDEDLHRELMAGVAGDGLSAIRGAVNGNASLSAFVEAALQVGGSVGMLGNLEAIAVSGLPAAIPALAELRELATALEKSGRTVSIDLSLPRDFEYYTGVVFDFRTGDIDWGGGGRYRPNLPGSPASACGIALDADALAVALARTTRRALVVSVVPATESDLTAAFDLARDLHRNGVAATLDKAGMLVSVTVAGDSLTLHTPSGDQSVHSLDEVVALLLEQK